MPGVQAELILGAIERKARSAQPSKVQLFGAEGAVHEGGCTAGR